MKKLKIADGIHMLTMNVEDILFEGIWETRHHIYTEKIKLKYYWIIL